MINNQNIGVLSEKVARLESDVKTLALPPVEAADEGKALIVNDAGVWEAATLDADNVEYSEGVSVSDKIGSITQSIALNVSVVENDLTESLANWRVTEKNGVYYFDISFLLKNHSATSDFVQVGTISNYSSINDINLNVPLQNTSHAMVIVNIRPSGNIYVYIPQALSVNMFCRTTATTIKS